MAGGRARENAGMPHFGIGLARADRHHKDLVFANGPAESITFDRGCHQRLQRGIVVRTHTSVDEVASDGLEPAGCAADPNGLGVEEAWSRGAGTHHLPQRVLCVRNRRGLGPGSEIASVRVVGDGPAAARVQTLGNHQQAGQEVGAVHLPLAVHADQRLLDLVAIELGAQCAPARQCAFEHEPAEVHVVAVHLVHRHAQRQRGCDDCASGRAGDEVEVVRQPEVRIAAVLRSQDGFDLAKHAQRQYPAQPAAVESQDALGTHSGIQVLREVPVGGHRGIIK